MTNEPTWKLHAIEDEDGAQLEAVIDFPDSDVAITVGAADMPTAVSRLASLTCVRCRPVGVVSNKSST